MSFDGKSIHYFFDLRLPYRVRTEKSLFNENRNPTWDKLHIGGQTLEELISRTNQ